MLVAALSILGVAVLIGLWLASLWLIREEPPGRLSVVAGLHAAAGLAGVAVLILALRGPARGTGHGAGSFGWTSGVLLVGALFGGGTILAARLLRRPIPALLVVMHASLGIAGYVLLAAYFSSPVSFGR